jgi:predicted cupin superfamily sugar epimerase
MTADEWKRTLGLQPHPEGGWYVETFRDVAPPGTRAASTAIYFLLERGQRSHWHRVDAAELWHFYAGAPLELSISEDGVHSHTQLLGLDAAGGQQPQRVVPPHAWQAARTLGDFTLVGCTVAPAFEFSRFELAAPGWAPASERPTP